MSEKKNKLTKSELNQILSEAGFLINIDKNIEEGIVTPDEVVYEYKRVLKTIKLLVVLGLLDPNKLDVVMRAADHMD